MNEELKNYLYFLHSSSQARTEHAQHQCAITEAHEAGYRQALDEFESNLKKQPGLLNKI